MNVVYHPEAENDVIEAARYYEECRAGLGGEFLGEVDEAVNLVQKDPRRFVVVEDDIHRHSLKRFPYAIFYRVTSDSLRILVVRHHSRHVDFGSSRR